MSQIKGNAINNCDFVKFIIFVMGGQTNQLRHWSHEATKNINPSISNKIIIKLYVIEDACFIWSLSTGGLTHRTPASRRNSEHFETLHGKNRLSFLGRMHLPTLYSNRDSCSAQGKDKINTLYKIILLFMHCI